MRVDHQFIEKEVLQSALNELKKRCGATTKNIPIDRDTDMDAHLELRVGEISHQLYI